MERINKIIVLMLVILGGLTGCYKQIPLEKPMVPVEFKVVPLDEPAPAQGEADIIITTHIKKKSYIFDPRTAETPYVFTLLIDGKELRESVKGVEEIISDMEAERGKGIHYNLKKRLRLKQGSYTIALRSEDRRSDEIEMELEGGKLYTLRFEPFYGLKKFHRPKLFSDGIERYKIYWEEIK
jgi:hypothetical protein